MYYVEINVSIFMEDRSHIMYRFLIKFAWGNCIKFHHDWSFLKNLKIRGSELSGKGKKATVCRPKIADFRQSHQLEFEFQHTRLTTFSTYWRDLSNDLGFNAVELDLKGLPRWRRWGILLPGNIIWAYAMLCFCYGNGWRQLLRAHDNHGRPTTYYIAQLATTA